MRIRTRVGDGREAVTETWWLVEPSDHEQIDWMIPKDENRDPLKDAPPPDDAASIRQLSAPELKALVASGAAIELVDVRSAEERAIATIDGSRLLDQAYHDALLLRDRDTPIVLQCHHGIRSQLAAEYFRRQGFSNLYNLSGGIDAWSALVDPSVPRY
jgi:monothiol glutaredoxin